MTAYPPVLSWFACRLRHRHEFSIRDAFRASKIEEFLPTFETASAWTDRSAVVTRPLFPGYAFARFDPAERAAILAIRGVLQILSQDQKPVPIPDAVIEDLQRVVLSPRPVVCCPYVAGMAVTVGRGPFAGVTGIVSRTKGNTLLTIPVQILGRSVSVEIDAADVATGE